MPLMTGLDILKAARDGQYGVGAFNTNDMEITQAILEAAEETRSPVLLALSEGALKYGGAILPKMVVEMARDATVPVAIHLDHGSSYESCLRAIRMGFTSVMIDKSHAEEEVNVRETARVVQAAHAVGVTVEAEIGRLGGVEEHVVVSAEDAILTKPDEAERFMHESGADYLAVAIGTSHGANKGKGRPYIDHDRIVEIASRLPHPLVMHGASGVPSDIVQRLNDAGGSLADASGIHEDDVRKAVTEGIAKINTDTDLRLAFTARVREVLKDDPSEFDPRKILGPARDEMRRIVAERMQVFGSAGKAD
ncbi:MAG: class II fructose-1,6-bisphosphate aldolase [Trueperaceae bacterium]|nr:class II fructose-1,6-bisphosphate aldolase [Trueperaceae bacterium]